MNDWMGLLDNPGWQKLRARLTEKKENQLDRLVALGMQSSDPAVRGVAMEIMTIKYIENIPGEEAETEAFGASPDGSDHSRTA